MTPSDTAPKVHPDRRALLKWLVCTGGFTGTVALPGAFAQIQPPLASASEIWRATSRVGYGPTPQRVSDVQAAPSTRAWALAQIDIAHAASQNAPRIAPDLAGFNMSLPELFQGVQRERQARAKIKAGTAPAAEAQATSRMDFSGPVDPLYFNRTVAQQAAAWRLMASSQPDTENPLLARMTEFWFNHLNVFVGKGAVRPFVGHYVVNVTRAHALGKFEDLLLASARHPAMLLYLDQARSVAEGSRAGPGDTPRGLNENYARELMELHTLGVDGGYTQNDVRELARVLTGWTIAPQGSNGFRFAGRLHDTGGKLVMGRRFPDAFAAPGEHEGEDAIRMLARHPKTAQRVTLRLAQFFVADQPSQALLNSLHRTFLDTGGDMRQVMQTLLGSADFWAPENRLFKTPMDFACSALAAINGATERRHLLLTLGFLANAGQPMHGWQTPDGYKTDAATWLVPEALTRRADYAIALARQTSELDFLTPFLSSATRQTLAQESPGLRAGLAMASPDFMYK